MVSQCTKFEISRLTRYEGIKMAVQNTENGVIRGHSMSTAMPPFDRAHTTTYSTLTEFTVCVYLSPFSRYSPLFVESRRF